MGQREGGWSKEHKVGSRERRIPLRLRTTHKKRWLKGLAICLLTAAVHSANTLRAFADALHAMQMADIGVVSLSADAWMLHAAYGSDL